MGMKKKKMLVLYNILIILAKIKTQEAYRKHVTFKKNTPLKKPINRKHEK